MLDALREFLTAVSGGNPLIWSLFVMAVVAGISLTLYFFWELLFRILSTVSLLRRGQRGQ